MSPEAKNQNTTKICPTCGTRLGINAARCSVCGSNLSPAVSAAASRGVSGPRIPEVTLSLPVVLLLAVLLLVIGAGSLFWVLRTLNGGEVVVSALATSTPTATASPTATVTATATPTATLEPTWTPLPPLEYRVAAGDTCISIAYYHNVSVNSIVVMNSLPAACDTLSVGQILRIPQPTPTPSPMPTSTMNPAQVAVAECETLDYMVKEGDTLGAIAANYAVSMAAIRTYNALPNDVVYASQKLIIPLCEQIVDTPTPTPVPPYPSPNLLLPADGASYTNPGEMISLQWASVGELRANEAYAVTIENVTEGNGRKLVEYVTDTKFIIPTNFRPASSAPHVFRWSVLPVRLIGTDKDTGSPVWEPSGSASAHRTFIWVGPGGPAPTETPKP